MENITVPDGLVTKRMLDAVEKLSEKVGELEKSDERLKSDIAHLVSGVAEIKVSLAGLMREVREMSGKVDVVCERYGTRKEMVDAFMIRTDREIERIWGIIKWGIPIVLALATALAVVGERISQAVFK